jgi:hypothetical protein
MRARLTSVSLFVRLFRSLQVEGTSSGHFYLFRTWPLYQIEEA